MFTLLQRCMRPALGCALFVLLLTGILLAHSQAGAQAPLPPRVASAPSFPPHLPVAAAGDYVLLGWNDLGMHCYNRDFSNLGVLPPYNTLWAQLVRRGTQPSIVTTGVTVEYSFPDNTWSAGRTGKPNKSNFWQYAQQLFGLPNPLPADMGLEGKGMAGTMDLRGDHFEAKGIPLTEYSDSEVNKNPGNPGVWQRQPYQLAHLVAKDANGAVLAQLDVVAPVSTEMRCDVCHSDGQRDGIATGKVETNILMFHDREAGTTLMAQQPVLCASCHASAALGAAGRPGLLSLSNAMHQKHTEAAIPNTTDGCLLCHPGPQTRCLRDVMSETFGFTCLSCHGDLNRVGHNTSPWLNEPRCDNGGCHNSARYGLDQPLYRMSKGVVTGTNTTTGHGGLYCEACHDSTHAVATSREPRDAIKFVQLQGHSGTLSNCSVCHIGSEPAGRIHPAKYYPIRFYMPRLLR